MWTVLKRKSRLGREFFREGGWMKGNLNVNLLRDPDFTRIYVLDWQVKSGNRSIANFAPDRQNRSTLFFNMLQYLSCFLFCYDDIKVYTIQYNTIQYKGVSSFLFLNCLKYYNTIQYFCSCNYCCPPIECLEVIQVMEIWNFSISDSTSNLINISTVGWNRSV